MPKSDNIEGGLYRSDIYSYTYKKKVTLLVAKEWLSAEDKVLIIDDFMANGEAMRGLIDIVNAAGATLVGIGWAFINVNSLPMVLEMCKGSEVGKFTGLYYTFSMSAQVITPILAGALMNNIGYKTLFPYAAFFVTCSFVTMLFVKHGESKTKA